MTKHQPSSRRALGALGLAIGYLASCSVTPKTPPTTITVEATQEWARRVYKGESVPELEAFATDLKAGLTDEDIAYLSTMTWVEKPGDELISDRTLRKAMKIIAARIDTMGGIASSPQLHLRLGANIAYADNLDCFSVRTNFASALAAVVASVGYSGVAALAVCSITIIGLPGCLVALLVALVTAAASTQGVKRAVGSWLDSIAACMFGVFDNSDTIFDATSFK